LEGSPRHILLSGGMNTYPTRRRRDALASALLHITWETSYFQLFVEVERSKNSENTCPTVFPRTIPAVRGHEYMRIPSGKGCFSVISAAHHLVDKAGPSFCYQSRAVQISQNDEMRSLEGFPRTYHAVRRHEYTPIPSQTRRFSLRLSANYLGDQVSS
jgi:hypothetical protein